MNLHCFHDLHFFIWFIHWYGVDCGICSGGSTGRMPNIEKDCMGSCFGNWIVDQLTGW